MTLRFPALTLAALLAASPALAADKLTLMLDWFINPDHAPIILAQDKGFYTEAGLEVETLPGATACIPALVQSGFPCDRFCFEGFLPQKKGRAKRLQQLAGEERTIVFYESPYRLVKCLGQLAEVFGPDRRVSVSRELTKKFEQTVRGTLAEAADYFREHEPRGEFVIVLAGREKKDRMSHADSEDE